MSLYGDRLEKYQHIERLGHDEIRGLLDGSVTIEEKLDGANASVAMVDGEFVVCSRNRALCGPGIEVGERETFGNLVKWVREYHREEFEEFFRRFPDAIVRGEWLQRHSISYRAEVLNKFYMFDVQGRDGRYAKREFWEPVAIAAGLLVVPLIAELDHPSAAQVSEFSVGDSLIDPGVKREGVVAKRYDFVNRFGRTVWGKVVTADFKQKNSLHFTAANYEGPEMKFVSTELTSANVMKVIEKIREEKGEVSVRDMGRVLGEVWYDLVNEELWDFVKNKKWPVFDFSRAQKLATEKTRDLALSYFNGLGMEEN